MLQRWLLKLLPGWGLRAVLVAPCLVTSACIEGNLSLRLIAPGFDDPYSELQAIEVRVLDAKLQAVGGRRISLDEPTQLGVVDEGRVRVAVWGVDAQNQRLARGDSRWLELEAGTSEEEVVPFSRLGTVTALPRERSFSQQPQIDGVLREWRASPSVVLDSVFRVSGAEVSNTDYRAELFVAWDPNQLSLALRVTDDCTNLLSQRASTCEAAPELDRVVLALDGTDDGGSEYGSGDFCLRAEAERLTQLKGPALTSQEVAVAFGLLPNKDGWALEAAISLQALGRQHIAQRDRVGFELTLIDEDPDQAEPTVLRLSRTNSAADACLEPNQMGTLGFGAVK